jgi:hypothetical protein
MKTTKTDMTVNEYMELFLVCQEDVCIKGDELSGKYYQSWLDECTEATEVIELTDGVAYILPEMDFSFLGLKDDTLYPVNIVIKNEPVILACTFPSANEQDELGLNTFN